MNAQTKHTPGPWYVENILHGGPRIVYGQADESGLRDDVPNTQENARLKSAAPDMYEALRELLESRDEVNTCDADSQGRADTRHEAAIVKARAAIAKAVTP